MASSPTSAVLLLSHGSKDPRAEFVVSQLVRAVARRTGAEVRAAHLDFTSPTPEAALGRLAADGFGQVQVVPLLFTPGYHLRHDIPKAVVASGVGRWLDVSVAPALVSDLPQSRRMLLRALVERLDESACDLDAVNGVVLAAAGSSSAHARSYVEGLARDLSEEPLCRRPRRSSPLAQPGRRPRWPRCADTGCAAPRSPRCSSPRAGYPTRLPGRAPACPWPTRSA